MHPARIGLEEAERNMERQAGTEAPRKELAERFVELMDAISLGLRPTILQAWSEIELTMHQFRTLALLRQGPQRVTDIASRLGIRLSAATSFVDRLETKRLVERIHDSVDRRVVQCQLTPLGRKEADALWRINREWLESVIGTLSDEDLKKIVDAFEVLSRSIERQTDIEAQRKPGSAVGEGRGTGVGVGER